MHPQVRAVCMLCLGLDERVSACVPFNESSIAASLCFHTLIIFFHGHLHVVLSARRFFGVLWFESRSMSSYSAWFPMTHEEACLFPAFAPSHYLWKSCTPTAFASLALPATLSRCPSGLLPSHLIFLDCTSRLALKLGSWTYLCRLNNHLPPCLHLRVISSHLTPHSPILYISDWL
ncbi:hypothetical protein C8R43DRAFT_1000024 [Mycena crocata]|nr:hypothetical protein C8R43DRAFT_1000024 [Mycena crocata]